MVVSQLSLAILRSGGSNNLPVQNLDHHHHLHLHLQSNPPLIFENVDDDQVNQGNKNKKNKRFYFDQVNEKGFGTSAPQMPTVSKIDLDLNQIPVMNRRPGTEPCAAPPIDIVRPRKKSSIWVNSPSIRRYTPEEEEEEEEEENKMENMKNEDGEENENENENEEDEDEDEEEKEFRNRPGREVIMGKLDVDEIDRQYRIENSKNFEHHTQFIDAYGAIFPLSPPITPPIQHKFLHLGSQKEGEEQVNQTKETLNVTLKKETHSIKYNTISIEKYGLGAFVEQKTTTTTTTTTTSTLLLSPLPSLSHTQTVTQEHQKQNIEKVEQVHVVQVQVQTNCFACSKKVNKEQKCCRTVSKAANRKPCRCGHPFCATHP